MSSCLIGWGLTDGCFHYNQPYDTCTQLTKISSTISEETTPLSLFQLFYQQNQCNNFQLYCNYYGERVRHAMTSCLQPLMGASDPDLAGCCLAELFRIENKVSDTDIHPNSFYLITNLDQYIQSFFYGFPSNLILIITCLY